MALSLRRANAVKDAWCATACRRRRSRWVGMGEKGLLVQTGDNVREPQNTAASRSSSSKTIPGNKTSGDGRAQPGRFLWATPSMRSGSAGAGHRRRAQHVACHLVSHIRPHANATA